MGQYDLPRSNAAPPSPQQEMPVMPTVPIPPEVFKRWQQGDAQALEDFVDAYIQQNKLNAGQGFQIPYPGGAKTFEYLGPESGGRKDWMEKGPVSPAPLTS
jgi:hypothetical protein